VRAAWFNEFGPAQNVLHVGDRDTPIARAGEVLVRVSTSGVNPSDVKKRAGSFPSLLDGGFVIPNSDGAQAQYGRRMGTAAGYVAIDSARAPELPDAASFKVGACLGIPAMTAHRCVFADGDIAGQTVLVTGGAGRVGHYAVQWASRAGATVIATASNDEDRAVCEAAGAARVVNHRDEYVAAAIVDATGGRLIDRIVDVEFGGNLATSVEVLRTGGTIATYASTAVPEPKLPFFQMMYKDITVRMVIVYAMPEEAKEHAIDDINRALSADALRHRIAQSFALDDIIRSNETVEKGNVRGAVILTLD